MNLSQIGDKYKTAKNTHKSFGRTLLDIYEPYFQEFLNRPIKILEIGVLSGASLFTWKEYFKQSRIYGIEINPPDIQIDNITVFKADQGDLIDLQFVMGKINAKLDIIIDDGSHINDYTLGAFDFFWPHLNSGGLYIIEDTICTYDKAFIDWPGMKLNKPGTNFDNKRVDIDNFILDHLKKMDFDHSSMYFMHFYRNLIIMKKG